MKIETNRSTLMGIVVLAVSGCYTGVSDMGDSAGAPGEETSGADTAAGSGGGGDTDGEGGSSGADSGGPGSGGDSGPPEGCLPGSIGCECLDTTCSGLSECIEGICTPAPPVPEVQGPAGAVAGVVISLEGAVDGPDDNNDDVVVYEQLLWEQIEGPAANIDYEFSETTRAYLPGDAAPDTELVFRLTARLGDVEKSTDFTVTIMPATATGPMDESPEVVALGASAMAQAGNDEVWLGTATGTLARGGADAISFTEELGSRITAISPYTDGLTLIAQPDDQVLAQFNQNNNMVTPFLSTLSGGGPLGPISTIAVDGDDNVYMGTEDGTIVLYDSPDGAEPAVTVTLHTLADTPTALALGQVPVSPDIDDDDEGRVLYYGTSAGNVMQIGLTAAEVLDGPEVGVPELYVNVPGAGAVTGLTVDEFGNMWVAKSSRLYLVRRAYEADPSVVREIDAPAGLAGFSGLQSDGGNGLTWIDPASGRVASLQTYQN